MRVLILYPELECFRNKSLGVSILSGIIKTEGHEVAVFDSSMYDQIRVLPDRAMKERDKVKVYWFKKGKTSPPGIETLGMDVIDVFNRTLQDFNPDLILVSATYMSYPIGISIITQSDADSSKVIYGGIHCTLDPESAIAREEVQCIHLGEAEISLPFILKKVENNEPIDQCPNLWVKTEKGEIVKNRMVDMVQNLDDVPFYDWDCFSDIHYVRLYEGNPYRIGDYSTSRGCVNRCSYCFNRLLGDAYGLKKCPIRRYSVERTIEELVYLKERYGMTFIKFADSDFLNKSASYLDRFSAQYRKYVNLPNVIGACVEHVTKEKARYLVRMNCRSVSIGMESGNEKLREQVLNRHYSNALFIKNAEILRKAGLRVSAPCMIGLPGETRENILETIGVCKRARVDHADFGIFFPFPKLPLSEYAIEKGYLASDRRLDNVIFGLESALDLKHMTHEALRNMFRCSMLYLKMPSALWPVISIAEKHNTDNGWAWRLMRWLYFAKLHFMDLVGSRRERRRQELFEDTADHRPGRLKSGAEGYRR